MSAKTNLRELRAQQAALKKILNVIDGSYTPADKTLRLLLQSFILALDTCIELTEHNEEVVVKLTKAVVDIIYLQEDNSRLSNMLNAQLEHRTINLDTFQ